MKFQDILHNNIKSFLAILSLCSIAVAAGSFFKDIDYDIERNISEIDELRKDISALKQSVNWSEVEKVYKELLKFRDSKQSESSYIGIVQDIEATKVRLARLEKNLSSVLLRIESLPTRSREISDDLSRGALDKLSRRLDFLERNTVNGTVVTASLDPEIAMLAPIPPNLKNFSEGVLTDGCLIFPNINFEISFRMKSGTKWCLESGAYVILLKKIYENGAFSIHGAASGYRKYYINCSSDCEFVGPYNKKYSFKVKKISKNKSGSVEELVGILSRGS